MAPAKTVNPKAPVPIPSWEKPDAAAMQALSRGEATPEQQRRALNWIIHKACATYDFCDKPESDRLSAIFDGRRFAGLQIVKLVNISISSIK